MRDRFPYSVNPGPGLRLTQKVGEKVVIQVGDEKIEVMVSGSGWSKTTLCYNASKNVKIIREKVMNRMKENGDDNS